MLLDLISKIPRPISLSMAVAVQFLVFCIFADCECLVLAVMAHGRYKAISSPLLYVVSMSSRAGSLLMAGVFLVGMTDVLIHTALVFHLCFCASNEINHFFCDLHPLFPLSRSGKWMSVIHCFWFYWTEYHFRSPFLLLLYHPINLEYPLYWGGVQTFSTHTSHLNVVTIF